MTHWPAVQIKFSVIHRFRFLLKGMSAEVLRHTFLDQGQSSYSQCNWIGGSSKGWAMTWVFSLPKWDSEMGFLELLQLCEWSPSLPLPEVEVLLWIEAIHSNTIFTQWLKMSTKCRGKLLHGPKFFSFSSSCRHYVVFLLKISGQQCYSRIDYTGSKVYNPPCLCFFPVHWLLLWNLTRRSQCFLVM